MRALGFALGSLVLVSLTACQSFIGAFSADDNIEAARNAGPPSGAFEAALQQEYIDIAQIERDEYDFEHADLFARKALAAAGGERVAPEDPGNWNLGQNKAAELYGARGKLLLALDNNGRTTAPSDAAHAQATFDCWVQEEELTNEGHQPEDIAACRDGFWDALGRVQAAMEEPEPMAEEPMPAPEPPARDYLVFFDFDKTDIRSDSASILDRVIDAIAALGSNSVTLVGHADRAGPTSYNQGLSERRAEAVRSYLDRKGVDATMEVTGRGEEDPRVPTPDGVREQENRRVEIRIN